MSLSIGSPASAHGYSYAATAGLGSAGSTATAPATQAAQSQALKRLVSQYQTDSQNGTNPATLQALVLQINSDASALGQKVTLPSSSPQTANSTANGGSAASAITALNTLA